MYNAAFYFIVATLVTVGYGDISGNNYGERAYIICVILFGVATFSFGVASFASIIGTYSSAPDY